MEEKEMLMKKLTKREEFVFINEKKVPMDKTKLPLSMEDIEDASRRLDRFAPFIEKCFPETRKAHGIIESDLCPIPIMKELLNEEYDCNIEGSLMLKRDSDLPVAGSIKARGGIYEVLKHAEDIALSSGIITENTSYDILANKENKKFFGNYKIQVGSTGNLGLSIGIASAAIGFKVVVHMSSDARQWKKDLLRSHGVVVVEYEDDYSKAVEEGRKLSDEDPKSYFVDDENSKNMFLGYAVAALRLRKQLSDLEVQVDEDHPLFVYLPCGVGGAPGGITFGLKEIFGDNAHCFFVEPVEAPCMTLGMISGLHNNISVQDIGLSGQTAADGLAVGRASGFVGPIMDQLLDGCFTMKDYKLFDYMRDLLNAEELFVEPSAAAAFEGPIMLHQYKESEEYLKNNNLNDKLSKATHITWATGGILVPKEIREEYIHTHLFE